MSQSNQKETQAEIAKPEYKNKDGIKEPIKLIVQILFLLIIFIPFTLWAIVSDLLSRKKCIRGNVVVVTGAGRGLGRGLALKFAELGCKVACADLDETNNAETVALIKKKYPDTVAVAYKCNVAVVDDIQFLSKNIMTDLGNVDIIVNNAGLVSAATIKDFKKSYLDIMLDVNLKSHFLMIQEFLPRMIQRNSGHIVAIASLAGLNGVANASIYSSTKHGLIGLMESLYDEIREIHNNRVQSTCICPYFIKTNENYSKSWDLRLPELTVRQVTDATIEAILKNKRMVAIPSVFYASSILRLLPDNLRNLIKDIFYTRFIIPETGFPNNIDAVMADTASRGT